jgi:hypothetical protein
MLKMGPVYCHRSEISSSRTCVKANMIQHHNVTHELNYRCHELLQSARLGILQHSRAGLLQDDPDLPQLE